MISKNFKKVISMVLVLIMTLQGVVFANTNDYQKHWAEKSIESWVDKGYIKGYDDGTFKPENEITRAEFVAIVNRSFEFTSQAEATYKDVETSHWAYEEFKRASAAGYIVGFEDGTFRPNNKITRQEMAAIISRLLNLQEAKDNKAFLALDDFAKIPEWSAGAVSSMIESGYVNLRNGNSFAPTMPATRAEVVAALDSGYMNYVKVSYDKAGTYTLGVVDGSVEINEKDIILEDATINGNLIIGEAVKNGNVTLKNITVKGDTIVKGGGMDTIIIEGSQIENLIIDKKDGKVRILAKGKTTINNTDMQSGGKLESSDAAVSNFINITIADSISSAEPIILIGNFEKVEVKSGKNEIKVQSGTIKNFEIAKTAKDVKVNLSEGVKVEKVAVNAAAKIDGKGKIGTATVNSNDVKISNAVEELVKDKDVEKVDTTPSTPTGGGSSGGSSSTSDDSPVKKSGKIDILLFNDFHGNVAEETKATGNIGMAKMVGYANTAKKNNPNTIVVAGGDNYQGTAMSNLTHGKPVSAMMKGMGVVASAVGNHEFDWGVDLLETWAKEGNFDFLAANIVDTKTNQPVAWAKPYKIIEQGGIKIAFLGLAHPDTVTLTKAENVSGLEFTDPVEAATQWVKYLQDGKATEGTPDVIIALTHIDSSQDANTKVVTGNAVKLATVKGLDAILSAHSHRTVSGEVNGVPIIQAYRYGRAMGVISIELDNAGKVKGITTRVDEVEKAKSDIIPDVETEKTYKELDKEMAPILNKVIGEATGDFSHNTREQANVTPLGKWASQVMKDYTGSQIAIQNGGGLRRTLYKGDITMGDLYEIMPFDNGLVTMDVKGIDIKKAIDHGILNPDVGDGQFVGLKVEYDKNKEFGNRITKISLEDGTPLDMDTYYSVVAPDFIVTGGDKYNFSNAKNIVETFVPVRDVLVEAIEKQHIITPSDVDYIVEKADSEKEEPVKKAGKIDILLFNDFHGNVAEDKKDTGNIGMAKMVGYANAAKTNNPNTIVVAGGDNYQGTAMSNLTHGKPVSAMMKGMGVVASAVGNHEFDWGVDLLETWAEEGNFDFLAANIVDTKTNEPVAWAKPYKIIEQGGIKIAFLGLAHPDTVTLTKAENVSGLDFTDPVEAATQWVKYLQDGKATEGKPDVIIALTHIDSSQDNNTKEITGNATKLATVKGLDAILSAHSHRTVSGEVNGTPIIQAYRYGRAIGVISIELDDAGKVKGITTRVDEVEKTKSDIIPDAETKNVFTTLETEMAPILDKVIGEATADFAHGRELSNVTPLGKWSSQVMRDYTGSQIAIQNGGGLRRALYKGDITMGDLYEIMPFDNGLVKMDVKGIDIKKAIDHGILNPDVGDGQFVGLKVEYDKNREFGNRITKISLEDGTPLDMDTYYSVVAPDFIVTGGDKYDFSNAKNIVETFVPVRDVLVEAIEKQHIITPSAIDYVVESASGDTEEPVEPVVTYEAMSIAEFRALNVNEIGEIEGVITTVPGSWGGKFFAIQGETGGIYVNPFNNTSNNTFQKETKSA